MGRRHAATTQRGVESLTNVENSFHKEFFIRISHTGQDELDKLEGPKYAARRAELRREARTRDRQAAAASQDEADESDATEEEATGGRTTRVGRPRGGMKVAARIGEGLRREIERGRRPRVRVGDG